MSSQAENDIRSLLAFVLRHPLVLFVGGFIGMLSFLLLFGVVFPPLYTAEVQIRISASLPSRVNTVTPLNLEDINAAKARAATCAEVLEGPSLYQSIIKHNNLTYSVSELQKKVQVVRKSDTEIISLIISDKSSEKVKILANYFSLSAPNFLMYSVRTGSASTISSDIIPMEDERPPLWLLMLMGIPVGAGSLGVLLIIIKMLLDLVICQEDLSIQYHYPVLAKVSSREFSKKQAASCARLMFCLSEQEGGVCCIRIAGFRKTAKLSSLCRKIANSVSGRYSVTVLDPDARTEFSVKKNLEPVFGADTKFSGNMDSAHSCTEDDKQMSLEIPPTQYTHILIKDFFQKGIFHTFPLQPSEKVVLVVEQDCTPHSQILHCLECLRLYHASVLGFIFLT